MVFRPAGRRYVLALLSVGLLRKFEAYPVYPSLIRSKNLRHFSFFQKFHHFTYMLLWFHLVIPSFPARIDDMRSRFSVLSKSDWFWFQSIVFTNPFKTGMSLDLARGRDSWCWPKGARPLGTRMVYVPPREEGRSAGSFPEQRRAAGNRAYLRAYPVHLMPISCPGGTEFDELSLPGDGAFDHHCTHRLSFYTLC